MIAFKHELLFWHQLYETGVHNHYLWMSYVSVTWWWVTALCITYSIYIIATIIDIIVTIVITIIAIVIIILSSFDVLLNCSSVNPWVSPLSFPSLSILSPNPLGRWGVTDCLHCSSCWLGLNHTNTKGKYAIDTVRQWSSRRLQSSLLLHFQCLPFVNRLFPSCCFPPITCVYVCPVPLQCSSRRE